MSTRNECCLLHCNTSPSFLSNLLSLKVLSTCRWVCFLVLLQLAENMGRFSRTLIPRSISVVSPFGHASLPCPSLVTHGHSTARPTSLPLNWELTSPPPVFIYVYIYTRHVLFGDSMGFAYHSHLPFSKSLSLPSHSACFDSLEISCYLLWYCKFPWYSLLLYLVIPIFWGAKM